jgi:hypothetical protein
MGATHVGRSALLAAVAILFGGCSGAPPVATPGADGSPASQPTPGASAPPPAGGGSTIAACDLLTDDQISQVLGLAVQSKEAGPVLGIFPSGCEWTLEDDSSVTVGVIAPGGRNYYETFFEPFIGDGEPGSLVESVPGIGDKAGRSDTGGIMAVKGDTLVSVEIFVFPSADDAVAEALTQAILARLP